MGRGHPSLHGIVHICGGEEGTEWDVILVFGLTFGLSWLDDPFFLFLLPDGMSMWAWRRFGMGGRVW